ncbi:ferredoxin-thioredoxin reductase, variable chain-like [Phragmites australis]|uniref:ferredoxin-thioredoxin reductase, variable chain-like n=1 Tax=Phragmites australis TaxID=29695 RepID=UPI002D7A347E|nr:ferredoxin-thioredoxin reductase, variable chain-like [Phragmites australis]XP_062226237.1 ferredoxin-thioredoxin reductase, variable chain-like [Phragmites australis]
MQFATRPPTSPMATTAATATFVASPSTSSFSLLPRRRFLPPSSPAARRCAPPRCRARLRIARQVAVGSGVSASPDVAAEEAAAAPKVGKRVRVTAPVCVHHVSKAPGLELRGMEGVVKQYVGVWKGKRITANLPFKVEFELKLDGQDKPVRFFAHLREEEFEIIGDK